jgi:hypothetical protein
MTIGAAKAGRQTAALAPALEIPQMSRPLLADVMNQELNCPNGSLTELSIFRFGTIRHLLIFLPC